ncbi:MAG: malonyl-ACP O-methyltransferase BioC [Gammaproteobacteria bacterium]
MTDPENPVIDIAKVQRSFTRAAHCYDDADALQTEVRDRLLERLELVLLRPARVLDLGSGTGKALPALAARYPDAEIIGVDLTPDMLQVAATRIDTPRLVCGDAARLPFADQSFDLVFSNLAIHWSPSLDAVLREVRRVMRHPGLFTFTTPGPNAYRELRDAWRTVDDLPHVMPFPEMRALGDGMVRAGLVEPVLDTETLTLTYRNFADLIRDLRATGTTNATHGRPSGLTGRQHWAQLTSAYEAARASDGLLPATVEIVFGQAWMPDPASRAATHRMGMNASSDEISVPLDILTHRPPRHSG